MRTIILILCCVGILSACTQQDVINSGVSSPYHDCNMMDYMRGDTYNWELTVQMIEQDRKSTRLNSSHRCTSRMPSSA